MAGEVGHVVYAQRVLKYLDMEVAGQAFWTGTLLPDIRHYGIVSGKQTHPEHVALQTLAGDNDFETGMRVHAWVDAVRNAFFEGENIKEELPWHPFVPHALKLLEDEILYDSFAHWKMVTDVLSTVHEEELNFVADRELLEKWHVELTKYLRRKPDDVSRFELSVAIGLSENSAQELNSVVKRLADHGEASFLVERFLRHLELLLR